jgi:2-C-methyl-D-erythritol 2,4-cyclodiphosphate synthase
VRIGQGFDAHRFVEGRPLILGGVEVPHDRGLEGHSDADVLYHAVADAILGALGAGDLGSHFPSSDERWQGLDSARIVEHVAGLIDEHGYCIANLDATLIAQAPRLAAHVPAMQKNLAGLLGTGTERINVKVTSTDRLGALGREEGIAGLAVVLLEERA